jgi:hypothetical protein
MRMDGMDAEVMGLHGNLLELPRGPRTFPALPATQTNSIIPFRVPSPESEMK